jgi:hypothetical protein
MSQPAQPGERGVQPVTAMTPEWDPGSEDSGELSYIRYDKIDDRFDRLGIAVFVMDVGLELNRIAGH